MVESIAELISGNSLNFNVNHIIIAMGENRFTSFFSR